MTHPLPPSRANASMPPVDEDARRPDSLAFGWRFAVWLLAFPLAVWLCARHTWSGDAVCVLLLGLNIAHGVHLQHQTLHLSGFRSRRANEIAGVLLGLPALVSYYQYRISHLFHHAKIGTPEHNATYDFRFRQRGWLERVRMYLLPQHCLAFPAQMTRFVRGIDVHPYRAAQQANVRRFYRVAAFALLLLALWCIADRSPTPALIWLIALIGVALPAHALTEYPEHVGCERQSTDLFANTRSISSNALMRWYTNANNLHVEHHLVPDLPFHRLARLHDQLRPLMRHVEPGYLAFYYRRLASARSV
jgi:fatty acid desaturase